jgi:hypothetical protein
VNFGAGLEHATVDASAHAARCQNINKPSAHSGANSIYLRTCDKISNHMLRTALPLLLLFCGVALAADLTGDYAGTYTTGEGNEGKVHLTLKKNPDTTWGCQFSFSSDSGEISAKTISCAIGDNKLTAEYEADVEGATIHVTTEATATGGTLEGTYSAKTVSGESIDQGKWKVSLKT